MHSQSFCTALEAKFVNYYNVKSVSFPIVTATGLEITAGQRTMSEHCLSKSVDDRTCCPVIWAFKENSILRQS